MVGNIYLIYGDDEYIKNMKIKEIQKKYNVEDSINKIDLNGEEWEEIYDELTLPSFLSTNKIITIYQAETNILPFVTMVLYFFHLYISYQYGI